jgi:hypothetical protein
LGDTVGLRLGDVCLLRPGRGTHDKNTVVNHSLLRV